MSNTRECEGTTVLVFSWLVFFGVSRVVPTTVQTTPWWPLRLLAGSVFVATALCGIVGCGKVDGTKSNQPTIHLLKLDGQPIDLWQKPAKVTVVLFTRSDCPISNRCAPEIRRLYDTYQARGVEFYLVYVDPKEQPDAIRQHLQEYEYPCLGLRDPKHALVTHCGATVTPEAIVFDQQRAMVYRGRVDDRYVDFGQARAEATTHDLADAIESTLAGQRVTHPRTKAIGCLIEDLKN
jgi:peroxiredoxin